MKDEHLKNILRNMAEKDVPADVQKLAEQTSKQFSQTTKQSGQQVHILWEFIMKSHATKLATAAAILIVAAIGVMHLLPTSVGWADVIEPILKATTAAFEIIIGKEDSNTPVIHDQVKGSRIRRTMPNMPNVVSIIDLETSRILTLDIPKKEAAYIDLKGLPSMPNYFETIRDLIVKLQDSPDFVVEELGKKEVNGRKAIGFRAKHPMAEIVIWADTKTARPIRIEQHENQMLVICRNIQFDVPMDDSLFSMEAPEGFTQQQVELDLMGSTEEDFIEGLRIQTETFGDGIFPEDVSVESYLKRAGTIAKKLEGMGLTTEQETELGMKLSRHLLFIRFFKDQGQWHYAGNGVTLGDAEKPIFWYRPQGSETYRVIYGDLHVEDVAPQDLPEPVAAQEQTAESLGYQQWSKPEFAAIEQDLWTVTGSGEIAANSRITLRKGPEGVTALPITLPYSNAVLKSVMLADAEVAFTQKGDGQYELQLPLGKLLAGDTKVMCKWTLPLESLEQTDYGYKIRLKSLTPVTLYTLKVALSPDSGWYFTKKPEETWTVPFTWNSPKAEAKIAFGSCGLVIKKIK